MQRLTVVVSESVESSPLLVECIFLLVEFERCYKRSLVLILPVSLITELSCLDFLAGAIHLHLILLRILAFVEFECHHYN